MENSVGLCKQWLVESLTTSWRHKFGQVLCLNLFGSCSLPEPHRAVTVIQRWPTFNMPTYHRLGRHWSCTGSLHSSSVKGTVEATFCYHTTGTWDFGIGLLSLRLSLFLKSCSLSHRPRALDLWIVHIVFGDAMDLSGGTTRSSGLGLTKILWCVNL